MPSTTAIGASQAASAYSSGGAPSAASLQAQLQRYQKQLSDCVNCPSSKTPQGKADIQAISARISQVKQSIEQAANAQANPAVPSQSTGQACTSAVTGYGGLVDVYA